jgi:hypothetical protein
MGPKDNVYFVYSDQQIKEDKQINNNIGRKFEPGNVSIGNTRAKYSKIILTSDLDKMTAMYPDTKIVTQGILGNIKYTAIDNGFVR